MVRASAYGFQFDYFWRAYYAIRPRCLIIKPAESSPKALTSRITLCVCACVCVCIACVWAFIQCEFNALRVQLCIRNQLQPEGSPVQSNSTRRRSLPFTYKVGQEKCTSAIFIRVFSAKYRICFIIRCRCRSSRALPPVHLYVRLWHLP